MKEQNSCPLVRDLLPSYLEELTEPETTEFVETHLSECPACAQLEQALRSAIPLEKPEPRNLKFLKRIKRTRLIAAALSLLIALYCMWWLYDQSFHYPNTEAGRLAAVEEYVRNPKGSTRSLGVHADTPIHAAGWQSVGRDLYIFYIAENEENVHGILHLVRGINGKYWPMDTHEGPSEYSGGIYGERFRSTDLEEEGFYLAGYNCRDIHRAEVEFLGREFDGPGKYTATRTFDLTGEDFLIVKDYDAFLEELGFTEGEHVSVLISDVKLFDRDGVDITAEYRSDQEVSSWGGGKSTAEAFLIYVYIAIVAILGVTFIRYFLRRD